MWKDDKFVIPDEIASKPEEVSKYYGEHYGDRYKDYDDLKTRAGEVDEWRKLGKREELQTQSQTFSNITNALKQGKVIVADDKGQLYARDPKDLTPTERQQVVQNPAGGNADEWLPDNFDELTPRQQAAAQRKAFKDMLDQTVTAKTNEFGEVLRGSQGQSTTMIDTVLKIQSAIQDHPEIKFKDLLNLMAVHASNGASNPLQAAWDEKLGPAEIERKAQTRAAEIIAESKLKADKEKSERILNTGSPLQNMMRGGKKATGRVTNAEIISGLQDKGLLQ